MIAGASAQVLVAILLMMAAMTGGCSRKELTTSQEAAKPAATEMPRYPSDEQIRDNWPRFRGPGGLGISAYANVPSSWSGETGEGILWKTPVPLPGESSSIVWGERVFLTGASAEKREVYCFNVDSGKLSWRRAVANVPGSPPEPPDVPDMTGFAAPTPVTDGERVCAIFANSDLACFDFDGKQVWARNMGALDNMYGHASSLVMYQGLLLVLLDQGLEEDGLSRLVALNAGSGETVWETKRPVAASWATPIVVNTGERDELITCANPWVIAYDPADGQELWRAGCIRDDVAPSPVYANGLLFTVNIRACLAAIRPGGKGDVTESHVVWTAEDNLPSICSPLSNGELVFLLTTEGILTCFDAADGTLLWDRDFEASFQSSPSLVGDRIYLMSEEGVMFIVAAGKDYQELGKAELGEDSSCSPAFLSGRIYIRGRSNLYCVGDN